MPNDSGLGIHATLDMEGYVRFGPDVEWLTSGSLGKEQYSFNDVPSTEDLYDVNVSRTDIFYKAIERYYPAICESSISPDYCGIRPKLRCPQTPVGENIDFVVESEKTHGLPGLINLFGIESPGITSSLSIGEYVKDKVMIHNFDSL